MPTLDPREVLGKFALPYALKSLEQPPLKTQPIEMIRKGLSVVRKWFRVEQRNDGVLLRRLHTSC
jgi:hypothetical protein